MLLGGSSAVRYPAGFFSGDIDMMGYNFTNASSLGTFPNSYLSGNFWVGGTSALNATTATSLDVNGATTCRNMTLDANYHIVQSGTGSYTGGTGAFDVNGVMTTKAITMDSGYDLVQAGAAYITVGTTGINATASPINILENMTLAVNKSLTLSGVNGDITSADTITGKQITATDDVNVTDTLYVADIVQSNDAGFTNVDISGTFDVNTPTMTVRNITLDANRSLAMSGTGALTTGTGTVDLNGAATTKNITTDSGYNIVIGGAGALTTGTGAVALNGNSTVAVNKTLAVTTADKLTVGGKIIPQELVIVWPMTASSVDESVFIPTGNYNVTAVEIRYSVAANSGPTNVTLTKCTVGEAPASGEAITSAMNLAGSANTVGSYSPTVNVQSITAADTLCLDYTGTMTALAGGTVTITLQRT